MNTKKREEATKRFEDYVAQLEKETEIILPNQNAKESDLYPLVFDKDQR